MNKLLDLCFRNKYKTDKYNDLGRIEWGWSQAVKSLSGAKVDKFSGCGHCYVEKIYGELLDNKNCKNILEIGIQDGGSIQMWLDFFQSANIFALDINKTSLFDGQERVKKIIGNAYSDQTVNFLEDNYFDLIIDDGSHLLQDMEYVAKNYCQKLNKNGILVIEDIDNIEWAKSILNCIPESFRKSAYIHDLRSINNRWDDIAIVINRNE